MTRWRVPTAQRLGHLHLGLGCLPSPLSGRNVDIGPMIPVVHGTQVPDLIEKNPCGYGMRGMVTVQSRPRPSGLSVFQVT